MVNDATAGQMRPITTRRQGRCGPVRPRGAWPEILTFAQREGFSLGNVATQSYSYDTNRMQLTSQTATKSGGPVSASIENSPTSEHEN